MEISKINSLALSWTIVHPINEESPFFGMTFGRLYKIIRSKLFVYLKAFDEVFSNSVVGRTSYISEEISLGSKVQIDVPSQPRQIHHGPRPCQAQRFRYGRTSALAGYQLNSCRPDLYEFLAFEIIIKKKEDDRREAQRFQRDPIRKESHQVKKDEQEGSAKQLQIINRTSNFKFVIAGFSVSKLDRPGKMEAIGDHHLWMIAMHGNDHRRIVEQRINGCAVNYNTDL